MLKIGIIGNGVHSKRIQKILSKKKIKFYLYKPNNKSYFDKEKYNELKKKNVIFILTPNKTHFHYINELKLGRYIFCEKPPVSSIKEINKLKKLNLKKVYFNFNFRHSTIAEFLKKTKKFNLGKLIYGKFIMGHGLAYKKEYLYNWRSSKKLCPKGVFELVSIHWIDMVNYVFGVKSCKTRFNNFSKKGSTYDTSYTTIDTKNNAKIDIISTYASPLITDKKFIFTNGIIEQNSNNIIISGPTKNLDKNNNFIKPKIIKKIYINDDKDYINSLNKSVDYFLNSVKKKKIFLKKNTTTSISSNKILLS